MYTKYPALRIFNSDKRCNLTYNLFLSGIDADEIYDKEKNKSNFIFFFLKYLFNILKA
jgi:hypothetical protein